MIVFVAGMSRSGSMWTYNVVRELFKSDNYTVKPRQIPTTQHELVREALTSSIVENEVYCIKTHLHVKNPLPPRSRYGCARDVIGYKGFARKKGLQLENVGRIGNPSVQ